MVVVPGRLYFGAEQAQFFHEMNLTQDLTLDATRSNKRRSFSSIFAKEWPEQVLGHFMSSLYSLIASCVR